MLTKKTYLTHVRCLECGHSMSYQPELEHCSQCDSPWLDAQYDYAQVSQTWKNGISNNITSLWRYMDLLPPIPAEFIVSMGEGNTPLIRANKLESLFGHSCIYIKDERQMPTNSFKDRQASVAISVLNQQGIQECVLASAGNAAISYSAYTAWADIKLWAFATPLVLSKKVREIAIYGAEVITVSGTYDESKKAASDFAKEQAIHCDKGAKAIAGKESMKTIAFEIAEQLAYTQDKYKYWHAPDWYIQAVSGGIGPLGVSKGFEELHAMGLIDRIPKIGIIQVEGCAPMVKSMANNQEKVTPVIPTSRIVILSTGKPGLAYQILRNAQLKNGGAMISVSDEEAFAMIPRLAQVQGISAEPAAAVAFAGLEKLIHAKTILPNETVIVNCSGHTLPIEKYIT